MNAFCILFSDTYDNNRISELSNFRTLASVPFGGRYRLVDFILSSLVKASVGEIGIITRNKYGSLMDHLGYGKDWDLDRKNGGLKILTPFSEDSDTFNTDNKFEALRSVNGYIDRMLPEYCILSDSNMVFNIDLNDVFKCHLEKDADITLVYRSAKPIHGDLEICSNSDGRITDALLHSNEGDTAKDVVMKIYIMKKGLLGNIVDRGVTFGWEELNKDFIAKNLDNLKIYAYKHTGYCAIIRSLDEYYEANMELLRPEIRNELFKSSTRILTRIKDSVPTTYGEGNYVKNSFVADGCYIDGAVENSIIFRDVKIERNAVIKNSIIMQGTVVEEGVSLTYVIADKKVKITSGKSLSGSEKFPFVIDKGKTL